MKNGTENGTEEHTKGTIHQSSSGLELRLVLALYSDKEQFGQILEKLFLTMKIFNP